jgi:hypothetical protein
MARVQIHKYPLPIDAIQSIALDILQYNAERINKKDSIYIQRQYIYTYCCLVYLRGK